MVLTYLLLPGFFAILFRRVKIELSIAAAVERMPTFKRDTSGSRSSSFVGPTALIPATAVASNRSTFYQLSNAYIPYSGWVHEESPP